MSTRFTRTASVFAALAAVTLSASSAFAIDIYGSDDPIPFAPRSSEVASRQATDFQKGTPGLNNRAVVNTAGEQIGHVRGFAKEGTGDAHRIYVKLDPAFAGKRDIVSFVTSATYGDGPIVMKDTSLLNLSR